MLRFAVQRGVSLDWTFYCTLGTKGQLDDEVRKLGARVIYSPVPIGNKLHFIRTLRAELIQGRYDVLHSHHDLVSGVYLLASRGLPIQRRLVHVHNVADSLPTLSGFKQAVLKFVMRRICLATADRIVGISNHALDTFLDGRARRKGRDIVHYCGVETSPFENIVADRIRFRRTLNVPDNARILLFAGRMVPEKEPLFAVDVLGEMHRTDPDIVGVFVGSGSLSEAVRGRALALGLGESFRDLGWRSDIPEIMSCCDCFIQPGPEKPKEGLGLAVVEAQLSGLHLLFSLGIPDDALLPNASYRRVALAAGPRAWASVGLELMKSAPPSRNTAIDNLKTSPFQMSHALSGLLSLHA